MVVEFSGQGTLRVTCNISLHLCLLIVVVVHVGLVWVRWHVGLVGCLHRVVLVVDWDQVGGE